MQPFIDLLRENVIFVFILGAWILSAVGGAIARTARKAEQQRRAQQRQSGAPTQRPVVQQPGGQQRRAPTGPTQRPVVQGPATQPPPVVRPAQPTAEDIAAEIRRVMGMEEPPRPAPVQQAPPPTPRPAPEPERVGTPTSHFEHFGEEVGGLRSQVDPHVGEGVSSRHAPTSGVVGSSTLGSLGGGLTQQVKRKARKRVRRFDLSDPAAALVTLEILGKPRALRDFEF